MYKVDLKSNRITALSSRTFSELKLKERDHLQEWLAHTPQALGEELLVIQKEFAGFDDTKERLDLLALDKDGRLVVIENKLDDSGRDVVWQALKYASYCSSLNKDQIVEIFQAHLNKQNTVSPPPVARQVLREFFEGKDFEEIKLNPSNEQRLILVAANFRKEVTSTALWLLGYRIRLQCFKVTPFESEDALYLNVDQIIPPPEAADYMIGIANKEVAEQVDEAEEKTRHKLRFEFWGRVLEAMRKSPCRLFDNVNPSDRHKTSTGSGISAIWYELVYSANEVRVGIYCDRKEESENKAIFSKLFEQRESIEAAFGDKLVWNQMIGLKGAQIQYVLEINGRDKENWPTMIDWLVSNIAKLEAAAKDPLIQLRKAI
ncbi:MAG: DUF4268 domain-containing protein [Betaproteobacteria bacterium]|nr:DUF4268 domain-containing protein [Betaproteobacteria bacterium]